jgi:hypothetical protein
MMAPDAQADAPAAVKIPSVVHYQARIADVQGSPVDGDLAVKVYVYDSATEGMSGDLDDAHLLYAEDHDDVRANRGRLNLAIGTGDAIGSFAGSQLPLHELALSSGLYVELEVEGETIAPRQRLSFARSAHAAAYASRATDLVGDFSITTASFPNDLTAARIECGTSAHPDKLNKTRLPQIPVSKLTDDLPASVIPTSIPISKIDPDGGTLAPERLPAVSAVSIQSGKFPAGMLPDSVLGDTQISVKGGDVSSGTTPVAENEDCSCMAAIHSTMNGGAEGINDISVTMNPTGGEIACGLSFEEGGQWSKMVVPGCEQYPDIAEGQEPQDVCSPHCTNLCCTMPGCIGSGEQQCYADCLASCKSCYLSGNVTQDCRASYMCLCVDRT